MCIQYKILIEPQQCSLENIFFGGKLVIGKDPLGPSLREMISPSIVFIIPYTDGEFLFFTSMVPFPGL
jgi:hypothetical protein